MEDNIVSLEFIIIEREGASEGKRVEGRREGGRVRGNQTIISVM